MSRNNDERVGAAEQAEAPPAPAYEPPQGNSSGLNFVTPIEFVALPSMGQFYPEGSPLHKQETIEMRHMTAKEEDILTSRTLLKKGLAIDRLLESIIVNKNIKIDELLVGDKNAIIVAARQSAYGDDYQTKVACQACGDTSEYTFYLSQHVSVHPDSVEEPEFTKTDAGTFMINLPKSGFPAEVRLLNGRDEKWLTKSMEQKRKAKIGESTLTDQMRLFIVSINGITDRTQVNQFINVMPAVDSRYLRRIYKQLSPNIDLTQEFLCPACGAESLMEVPFTADFFWPQQ